MSCSRAARLALLICCSLMLAACGGSTTGESPGGDGGAGDGGDSGGDGGTVKVGLVTDQGGLNDRSFNALANQGLQQAKKELDVEGSVLESKSGADYEPNLGRFAQENYDLVLGIGFLMQDPLKGIAEKFPNTNFAIVDATYDPPVENIRGLTFKEQEAGYLAGALAGMVEQDGKLKGLNKQKVVSAVGGQSIPPVNKFIAGYQAGVKKYCKGCKVLVAYSQDFVAQDKCKEQALAQIGSGSDIVFQVAGGCGLGALDAAKERGVWGIGVDADQAYLGPHILTSAVKKVDRAVFETIQNVVEGNYEGGGTTEYGVAEGGVGLGKVAPAAKEYEARLGEVIEELKAGSIDVPTEVQK